MSEQQSVSVFTTIVAGILASLQVLAVVAKLVGTWKVSWWAALFFLWGVPLWGVAFFLGMIVVTYIETALRSGGTKDGAH